MKVFDDILAVGILYCLQTNDQLSLMINCLSLNGFSKESIGSYTVFRVNRKVRYMVTMVTLKTVFML